MREGGALAERADRPKGGAPARRGPWAKSPLKVPLVALLAAGLACLHADVASAQALQPAPPPSTTGPDVIDYRWSVRELGGDPVELEAYSGRVLFINAWASWCIPCIREMAGIERLAARLADTDVVFLLVAVEGESSVRRHLRRYPIALPVFLEHRRFPAMFGLRGIPMTWIVDREGRIVHRHRGAAEWDAPVAEGFLRELVKGDG